MKRYQKIFAVTATAGLLTVIACLWASNHHKNQLIHTLCRAMLVQRRVTETGQFPKIHVTAGWSGWFEPIEISVFGDVTSRQELDGLIDLLTRESKPFPLKIYATVTKKTKEPPTTGGTVRR